MKWVKLTMVSVLAVSACVQAQVEKPVVMDEAMISISIPNVHGFFDEAGLVVSKVQPAMNGAMIKMMLGMQLGDMNLAGIPANGGLSVVAMDPTNMFAVLEVSEAQSSAYLNMAKAQNMQAAYTNGLVVVAQSAAVLETGSAKAGSVKSTLLDNNAPILSIAMQPSEMIARNREAIDGFMQMMPGMLGMTMMQQPGATLDSTESVTKILQAELLVLLSLSEQSESAELKIAPVNGSLNLSETFVPKAGTGLADLVNAPVKYKENSKIHSGLLGDGTMRVDMHFANPDALAKFIALETEKTVKAMDLDGVDAVEISKLMTKWVDSYAGTGSEVVSFGEDSFNIRYIMEVADETRTLEVLRSMDADMEPFLKMYEEFGIPMSMNFKENVREADGLKIHEFGFEYDLESMAADQKKQFEDMGIDKMKCELAITDGMLFFAEVGGMESVVKTVKSGADAPKIAARNTYPTGGFYYLDWDMGEYMAFIARSMPDDPSSVATKQQMSTMFMGTPPITSAGFKKDGAVNWSLTIPGELLAKYGQMIMMQTMQQGAGAPAGVPTAAPVQ